MALPLDKLLALKAFHYGLLSAQNVDSRLAAIQMLSAAIEQLRLKTDRQSQLRLAFYHLVRAELHRYGGDPLPDRQYARHICSSIGSLLYTHSMLIVDSTTAKTRGPKRVGRMSAYGATAGSHGDPLARTLSSASWLEFAFQALGESSVSLTNNQRGFLEHANLLELFNKHGIATAP